jgi:hypothetical protein
MTSQINPYNINGAYPVAGQDNNSQGFRTNFTNTSTNFEYAAQEITALQSNAILKAAIAGVTLDNDMNGSLLFNAQTQQITQTALAVNAAAGTATVNWTAASYFYFTTSVPNTVVSFPSYPNSGVFGSWTVAVTIDNIVNNTVTFPTAVTVNARGIRGWNTSTNTITFAALGTYTFQFSTSNGGTVVTVNEVNKTLQPFNASSESLASAGAANLALTTSYFSTSGTATLAAGVAGQIKTFMQTASTTAMVLTVTNAGWKASGTGTITFPSSTYGTGCTLQYINSKWYCIGNNGCTFA